MGRTTGKLLVTGLCAAALWATDPNTAVRGREVFQKRCTGCHSLDTAKVGPPLRGVYGRRAAADPEFPYSDALKRARITWDDSTLDRWLADPASVVADNDMSFRLDDADERAAIRVYLKQLSSNHSDARGCVQRSCSRYSRCGASVRARKGCGAACLQRGHRNRRGDVRDVRAVVCEPPLGASAMALVQLRCTGVLEVAAIEEGGGDGEQAPDGATA